MGLREDDVVTLVLGLREDDVVTLVVGLRKDNVSWLLVYPSPKGFFSDSQTEVRLRPKISPYICKVL